MYEVVVRSARECILIPLAGDVRVNVDHRVVRIGLADKTVHLRFLNLRDSCRFTALVLEVMEKLLRDPPPGAFVSVSTISTEKLFMWADYVPACAHHRQFCRKGELLWAFWIALSAIWAVVKLSRMIPVEVWQGWMVALHDVVASLSKNILDFCGVPFSQTILDWTEHVMASLLSAVNFLVPVHFILPIEAWLQSLYSVFKALSFPRFAEIASWISASASQALAVFNPLSRMLHNLVLTLSFSFSVLGSFCSHCLLILSPLLAPFRLLFAFSCNLFRFLQASTLHHIPSFFASTFHHIPAFFRPLLASFSALARTVAPIARRLSDTLSLPLSTINRMGGSNVASAGSTAARYSLTVMCDIGGTVWRHVKAAFVETVRLCFQKIEARHDRGLAISTEGGGRGAGEGSPALEGAARGCKASPSPLNSPHVTPRVTYLASPQTIPLAALRRAESLNGLHVPAHVSTHVTTSAPSAGFLSCQRSPSPLFEIRSALPLDAERLVVQGGEGRGWQERDELRGGGVPRRDRKSVV